jgi:hypothetical protein
VSAVRPASAAFERFARETLGCQCEPEVFSRVEDCPAPVPDLPEIRRRIAVGGRLLIYVAEMQDGTLTAARMRDWVGAGIAERDGRGFNRLRLVVALNEPMPDTVAAMEDAFARLPGLDDRVHLHVVRTDLVPVDI